MRYLLLTLLSISFFACKNPTTNEPPKVLSQSMGSYISKYTEQNIDIDEKLMFRFSGTVISADEIGKEVTDIFSIRPQVKGKAHWKDGSTLIFTPEEELAYDASYKVSIQLSKLFPEVSEDKKKVELTYKTNPLNLEVRTYSINYGESNNSEFLSLEGKMNSNNVLSNEAAEKLLKATQKGNNDLTITWDHSSKKKRFFTIENILRSKKKSEVRLTWKAPKGESQERTLQVLPVGKFSFLEAEIDQKDNKTIVLSFSDKISRSQDLTGLVSIEGYKGKLTIDKTGSKLRIYGDKKIPSPFTINISKHIKRNNGDKLQDGTTATLSYEPLKPSLEILGDGVIVPDGDEIIFPFVAKNLNSATVEIFKIFEGNVLQTLQSNAFKNTKNITSVGRVIHREKINLYDYSDNTTAEDRRISLNIKNFIVVEPGAIYQVRVGFDQSDLTNYECPVSDEEIYSLSELEDSESIMAYRGYVRWDDREDPCKSAYYRSDKYISRNILASDLGIIAKVDKANNCYVAVTDLNNINPVAGAEVEYYDYQQQLINTAGTGSDGQVKVALERTPSFLILKHNSQYGYVNLQENQVNVLSEFNVSGKTKKKGIDGFLYGERGVWRPGDTLFLNFVLEDNKQTLPHDHPIQIELKDSRSKTKFKKTSSTHLGHIYHFAIPTSSADPTGNWRATVKVGNQKFTKTLKVETVKPNRLKIAVEVPDDKIKLYEDHNIKLESQWLHGASADGLQAKVDVQLRSITTNFNGYSEYIFDDPARKVDAVPVNIFDGQLDEKGQKNISFKKQNSWLPPGKLNANLKTRVYEKSGNFSEDNFTVETDVYSSYVGIRIPQTRWGSYFISNDGTDKIKIQTVDVDGKALKNRKVSLGIYQARWSWWYDRAHSQKYNYNSAKHNGAIVKDKLSTDSKGQLEYAVNLDEDYGTFMIRICDEESGHCTGGMFYTGRNWYSQGEKQGPQLLNFTADKKEYNLGENIKVKIPSNQNSKIYVSIENGERVLDSYWVNATGNMTEVSIPTTSEMNPNIYVHAALVQQHSSKENDLPLRMYGVLPLKVVDPYTTLTPKLRVPDQAKPDEYFELKVSESNGQAMHYTVAVVDEGLLGLTRYQVPNIWEHFFAKQAIGVKTWDIYDLVLSGYGSQMDKLISIGGDGVNKNAAKPAKANRFKPVVQHLGPFRLEAGQNATHKIKISDYVGAVRTMIVAREEQKYGSTEKTTLIKKPLMVQATLPRVLGPGESLDVPANVFAMEDHIKNVEVSFKSSGMVSLVGDATNKIEFTKQGDQLSQFKIQVGNQVGVSKMNVSASSGKEISEDNIEIEVRNPNPVTTKVQQKTLQPGETWTTTYDIFGTDGTNEGVIELSNVLPINLDKRLKYLIRYPYGCIEQTTSSAFPQLYLNELAELSPKKVLEIEKNIQRTVERLSLFQLGSGGMSYWPGNNSESEWGSIYAYHFLQEAKDKGYFVPKSMIDRLTSYLTTRSEKYKSQSSLYHHQGIVQTYRLYTLAKAGQANLGAMNRLRNNDNISTTSAHLLAAAYALINKKDIALALVNGKELKINAYNETGYSYGSHLRDQAIILETLSLLDKTQDASKIAELISKELNSEQWYSTHSTSFALLSVGKYISRYPKDKIKASWKHGSQNSKSVESDKAFLNLDLTVEEENNKTITVTNTSEGVLYAKMLVSGQAPPGSEGKKAAKHLSMKVEYKDLNGDILNPAILKQGTDFLVEVTIKNLGTKGRSIQELALSQIFPSGWEIQNLRLSDRENINEESNYEYRDIRDDRVNTFFDIVNEKLTYTTMLSATYAGKFYLPPTYVEAMYDNEIQAKSSGQWIEVIR